MVISQNLGVNPNEVEHLIDLIRSAEHLEELSGLVKNRLEVKVAAYNTRECIVPVGYAPARVPPMSKAQTNSSKNASPPPRSKCSASPVTTAKATSTRSSASELKRRERARQFREREDKVVEEGLKPKASPAKRQEKGAPRKPPTNGTKGPSGRAPHSSPRPATKKN